jgi:hypothetical protein
MKKSQFLLLDAGPIIKLFELGIWDKFIKKYDVTISRTIAEEEVVFASKEDEKEWIDLSPYESLIKIVDVSPSKIAAFHSRFATQLLRIDIHHGEIEILAFFFESSEPWRVCASDGPVFQFLGMTGKSEQGISLEEVLREIGLSQQKLEWQYTKGFREKYTGLGRIDSIQSGGL